MALKAILTYYLLHQHDLLDTKLLINGGAGDGSCMKQEFKLKSMASCHSELFYVYVRQ